MKKLSLNEKYQSLFFGLASAGCMHDHRSISPEVVKEFCHDNRTYIKTRCFICGKVDVYDLEILQGFYDRQNDIKFRIANFGKRLKEL